MTMRGALVACRGHDIDALARKILAILREGPLDCGAIGVILGEKYGVIFRTLLLLVNGKVVQRFKHVPKRARRGRCKMLYALSSW